MRRSISLSFRRNCANIADKIGAVSSRADAGSLAQGGTELAGNFVQRMCSETQSLHLELQCFRPLQQFHVTGRLEAVGGSWLEQWIENAAQRKTLFSQLPSPDSIFALIASLKLEPDLARRLTEAWQPLAAAAKAAVPSPRSRDRAEALLGRLVERAVDAVTATIQPGELDGGLIVDRQGRDQVVVLAGATLLGARSVEQAATEVGQLLRESAEFRAMQWSRTADGDVAIHQLKIPATDDSVRKLLGDPIVLAVGAGTDRGVRGGRGQRDVGALIGSGGTIPRRGPGFRRRDPHPRRLAPFLAILAAVPGSDAANDAELHRLAAQIAPYKKNDTLELSLKAADQVLEGRLQVDMGIVRMLALQIPVTGSPDSPQTNFKGPGRLRLPAGERFQLEFYSKNDGTTKIDGNDRREIAVHSLTYDFRVDKVDSDGTMHIATSLSRATIDKTTPDGRERFDSANPPESEKMTAEMLLHGAAVGQTFTLTIRPDGTIARISGLAEAIENVLDTKLQPPANEREQARTFMAQILNEGQLRDSLTRGFEFYPDQEITRDLRWTRTTENASSIKFLLDNRYQISAISPEEVVIAVGSQIREPDADDAHDQPVRWEIAGSQAGTIKLEPGSGRLRLAEYTLRLDAKATFKVEDTTVSRPVAGVVEMIIGTPQQVAEKVSKSVPAPTEDSSGSVNPADARPKRFERDSVAGKQFRMSWQMDGQRGFVAGLTLETDGRITGSSSDNEAQWQVDRSGNLVFYGRNRNISTTFNQKTFRDGRWFLSGPFQINRSVTHFLEEVPELPKVLDDETLNQLIRPWSKQRIVSLNRGESYRFELADGTSRVVRVDQVQETRDTVLDLVRSAGVRVQIDGRPVDLDCAPYVMPTELDGLRIQADITSGMLPGLPKQVQLSLWDAHDPIVNTDAFGFPLRDYRLFSHDLQAYNEVVWLGLHDGDPRGVTERHSYGIDLAGFEGGETVLAATDGVVRELWRDTKDPYAALIESNGGIWEYGHMQSILPEIREGVAVRRGQPIGILGKRGGSGNFSHLHLGLYPSPAHRAANIRTQRVNFFPWIVTVYRAAHAQSLFAFAGAHQVLRVGETCSFDASRSLAFDSKIVSSSWRFHDGQTVDRPQADKTYEPAGNLRGRTLDRGRSR